MDVKVAQEAQEQTLRTIVDLVLTQHGDYRDLFTTRKTFLTPTLGSIYRVPVAQNADPGSRTSSRRRCTRRHPRPGKFRGAAFA